MSSSEEVPHPPAAPEIRRQLQLHRWQWIGIPVLMLIPVLALFGLFGETRDRSRGQTAELAIEMQYPTRYRYKLLNSIRLDVTNTTTAALDTVSVDVDTAYASRFSTVVAIPAFERPYLIELTDLQPGETRRVRVELQGERFGRHSGELRVSAGGADTARLQLSTFIFP